MFTLSKMQFFLFLFVIQTGTIFIAFQDDLLFYVGSNAWLLFIIMGLVHYGQLVLYERFHERFTPGKIIVWMYKAYWLFVTVVFIAYVEYTLSIWIYADTPSVVIIGIIVFVSLLANLGKPEAVINLATMLLHFVPIILILIFFTVPDYVWTRLFPIYIPETDKLFKGMLAAQSTFIGIEMYLFLRKFVLPEAKVKGKPLFYYQSIWFLFFFMTLISVQLFFPIGAVKLTTDPFLYLLKAKKMLSVERLDLFFAFIWMIWSLITICLYSFMALTVQHLHVKKYKKRNTVMYHILLVILPLFLVTKEKVEQMQNVIIFVHLIFTILLPLFIIIFGRKKKDAPANSNSDGDAPAS